MNRLTGWRALTATLLLAGAILPAKASVMYVSEWRATSTDQSIPFLISRLDSLGVVALQTPTLEVVGRWTNLPPAMDIVASADGRWLFLWNELRLEGGLADDARLHVVERSTMQVVASWSRPPSADARCNRPRFDGAVEDAIAHPLRPRVVMFSGACWFDTQSGAWVATPTSLGMPANFELSQLRYERVSDDGRFLTFWGPQNRGGVIDLAAGSTQLLSPSVPPGRVIAFGGESIVEPLGSTSGGPTTGYRVVDRTTLAQRGQFTLPIISYEIVPDRRWGVLLGTSPANGSFSIYRLAQATGQPLPFLSQPLPADAGLRIIALDEGVLTGYSINPGCYLITCLLGEHSLDFVDAAGVPQGSLRERRTVENGVTTVVSYTLNGNAVVGGQLGPVLVPALSIGWLAALTSVLALAALVALRARAARDLP